MIRLLCCMVAMPVAFASLAPVADIPPLKPVEVITDPAEIEAAKQVEANVDAVSERAVGWAIRSLLHSDYLPGIYSFEAHRAAAIPRLKKLIEIAGETPVPASIAASHYLYELDEPGYESQIATALDSDIAAVRRVGLELIQSGGREEPLAPATAIRVLSLINDADPAVATTAANVAGVREMPGFAGKLQSSVRAGRIPAQDVAHWLGRISDDPAMFDRIAEISFPELVQRVEGGDAWVFPGTLTSFLDNPNAKVAEHARARLRQMVRRLKPEHRRSFTFSTILGRVATAEDVDLLQDVLEHAKEESARGATLEALARVQPEQAAALALQNFDKSPHAATGVLANHATEADSAAIVEHASALSADRWTTATVDLLIDQGGDAGKQLVRSRLNDLDVYVQSAAKWRLEGFSLAAALREFQQAGVITTSPEQLLAPAQQPADAPDEDEGYVPASLEEALEQAGVLLWWDAESGELPVRHDHLLTAMAEYSNDYFRPKHVSEKWLQRDGDDFDAPYRVQFIHDGKLFRVEARNLGDWYDVEAVLAAANKALELTGRPERFIPLDGGDQMATLLFAEPKVFAPLAEKYGMKIGTNPDAARQHGLEFEKKVLNQLDAKELD